MKRIQLTINVPDEADERVQNAFAAKFRYDESSGVTKAVFLERQIMRMVSDVVLAHERDVAEEAARREVLARSLELT